MTSAAIILVVVSAFIHAGWNLLSKSRRPGAAFFLVASLAGAVLLAPCLVLFRHRLTDAFTAHTWLLLAGAGFFMALYYFCLGGAYRTGDMSVAYPLARSSPVMVVLAVAVLLGRGEEVSPQCVLGIVLVVGGCFLVPLRRFRGLHMRNYWSATCGLALLAAAGTAGYSILDDLALAQLRTGSRMSMGNVEVTLVYACLEAFAASLWLGAFIALRRSDRASLREVLRADAWHALAAGVAIIAAYCLVLISLAFADNVSYIVGFRQLSIPLGAAMGILILREAPYPPKLAGVAVMFTGLILIALG
jgi:drug/metabolite transporter (DMT)-like permease